MSGTGVEPLFSDEVVLPISLGKKVLIGVDIGKWFLKIGCLKSSESDSEKSLFKTVSFKHKDTDDAFKFIEDIIANHKQDYIEIVSLGLKNSVLEEKLNITTKEFDETDCFAKGFSFCLDNLKDEDFMCPYEDVHFDFKSIDAPTFVKLESEDQKVKGDEGGKLKYPAVLCVAGSNTKYLLIDENKKGKLLTFSGVGGSCFMGMSKLITDSSDFNEIVEIALKGDKKKVNYTWRDLTLKGDTYGGVDFDKMVESIESNSPGSGNEMDAFFFGKAADAEIGTEFKKEDVEQSVLVLFSYNILEAAIREVMIANVSKVYFCGNFFRKNKLTTMVLKALPISTQMYGYEAFGRMLNDSFGGYLNILGALLHVNEC